MGGWGPQRADLSAASSKRNAAHGGRVPGKGCRLDGALSAEGLQRRPWCCGHADGIGALCAEGPRQRPRCCGRGSGDKDGGLGLTAPRRQSAVLVASSTEGNWRIGDALLQKAE